MSNPDCLFCKIIAGDIDSDIVYRNDKVVAFRDINPQAPTHVLIVPRTHVSTVNDVTDAHLADIGHMFLAAKAIATEEGVDQSGYRLTINCMEGAGQSVFHIHLHLLGGRAFNWPPG